MSKILLNKKSFDTLLVVTEEEQSQGLMNKPWPPPIMTFIYKSSKMRSFWMYRTPSPLDIVFCNDNKIVHIAEGVPNSTQLIYSMFPSSLVVELPKGTCFEYQIDVGSEAKLLLSRQDAARLLTTSSYLL